MSSEKPSTRTRALQAAWTLLEQGGSKVRMSDIAKAAGISRQALYLHFPNRADLLIATTRYVDEQNDVEALLAPSRTVQSGEQRLERFIAAWARYIPRIYGVGHALMAMQDSDDEARRAWADRMGALRAGCAAAIGAIERDGQLSQRHDTASATDLLMMLLAVPNWAYLTRECGWSAESYTAHMTETARRAVLKTCRAAA